MSNETKKSAFSKCVETTFNDIVGKHIADKFDKGIIVIAVDLNEDGATMAVAGCEEALILAALKFLKHPAMQPFITQAQDFAKWQDARINNAVQNN